MEWIAEPTSFDPLAGPCGAHFCVGYFCILDSCWWLCSSYQCTTYGTPRPPVVY